MPPLKGEVSPPQAETVGGKVSSASVPPSAAYGGSSPQGGAFMVRSQNASPERGGAERSEAEGFKTAAKTSKRSTLSRW